MCGFIMKMWRGFVGGIVIISLSWCTKFSPFLDNFLYLYKPVMEEPLSSKGCQFDTPTHIYRLLFMYISSYVYFLIESPCSTNVNLYSEYIVNVIKVKKYGRERLPWLLNYFCCSLWLTWERLAFWFFRPCDLVIFFYRNLIPKSCALHQWILSN